MVFKRKKNSRLCDQPFQGNHNLTQLKLCHLRLPFDLHTSCGFVCQEATAYHTLDNLVNMQPSLIFLTLASAQGVKEHKCGICGREFTLLANMKRHVLIHTNIRAYQCHLCYKSFVQKQTLKAHMIVHSDVKPFKCKVGRRKDSGGCDNV